MTVISLRWFGPLSRFAEWVHQARLGAENKFGAALRSKSAKEQLDSIYLE